MTAPLDLDALKAKALAATPGEWMHLFGERTVYDRMADGCRGNAIVRSDASPPTLQEAADLDHIAAASPAVMLELLARLERAEASASAHMSNAERLGRAIDQAGADGGVRAPGMTFTVSNMVSLAQKMGAELHACWMAAAARGDAPALAVDPTKGHYNCAGDYVMPKPFYDPSLQVPAVIVAAANMVSTWAADQNRGAWRIGNVCSADFDANQEELARLRSGNAILRQQSKALHLVGHELGLPAGTDVARDVLPKVKHLVMVRNLLTRGPMPGHVTLTVATERDGVPFTSLKVLSKGKAASERTASEFHIAAAEFEHLASQAFLEVDNFLNAGGAA